MPPEKGASPERTGLAWRRTSLSATVAVILLWRLALWEKQQVAAEVIAALGALAWILLLFAVQRRVHATVTPTALRSARLPMLTAAACVVIAVLGILLIAI